MLKRKYIILILCVLLIAAGVVTFAVLNKKLNKESAAYYADSLFDTSYVHKVNVEISREDWLDLVSNPTAKTKYKTTVTIDGKKTKEVAFSTKGTTSLTQVADSDSNRYSFKLNFGKYIKEQDYLGLDKLNLNNAFSDSTYMKDYLSYQIMRKAGVEAPLASFAELSINGRVYGLYIAIEEVEDSFIARNSHDETSVIYKPENENPKNMQEAAGYGDKQDRLINTNGADLVYVDDNIESYSAIFDNAQTDCSKEDKLKLIEAIKALNDRVEIEEFWNVDSVISYFAAHNFLLNFDSYTTNMLHNYYLLEENGKVSVVPWDYNLAFGTLERAENSKEGNYAENIINWPIDSPLSDVTEAVRPLWSFISNDESYLSTYHEKLSNLISDYFESGECIGEIDRVYNMIRSYVSKDPTAFYKVDEFDKGVKTLKEFCTLRAKSIKLQIEGKISSTEEERKFGNDTLVDCKNLDITTMGTQGRRKKSKYKKSKNEKIKNEKN